MARDRDDEGRAHNARPRDASGRPLPRGADGVERPDEDVVLPPEEALVEAQRLLDGGFPFHAHEILEGAWKAAPDGERALWKGLAQLAVGLTHEQRGNLRGAVSLLHRGADTIAEGGVTDGGVTDGGVAGGAAAEAAVAEAAVDRHGLDRAALVAWGHARAERLEAGADPGPGLRLAP